MAVKTEAQIRKIKNPKKREAADHAFDRARGIKMGSKKDKKIDKSVGVKDKD